MDGLERFGQQTHDENTPVTEEPRLQLTPNYTSDTSQNNTTTSIEETPQEQPKEEPNSIANEEKKEDKFEFEFKKCFKNGNPAEVLVNNFGNTFGLVNNKQLNMDYIQEHMTKDSVPDAKEREHLIKLSEIATKIKIATENTTFNTDKLTTTLVNLKKTEIMVGGTIYWRKDFPMFLVDNEITLVIAPQIEEDD